LRRRWLRRGWCRVPARQACHWSQRLVSRREAAVEAQISGMRAHAVSNLEYLLHL
jgi:hypothetical protein